MKLDLKAAAILIWMPPGEEPSLNAIGLDATKEQRSIRVEGYWELGAALTAARGSSYQAPVAWVRVGTTLLNPDQVGRAYAQYRSFEDVDV